MKVSEVMTPRVNYINQSRTVQEAATIMRDLNVGAVPVEDNDKLVGMITDRDLAVRVVAEGRSLDTTVEECMSRGVEYCYEDESVDDVRDKMSQLQIRRLPIMSRKKRLVGIVSLGDLAVTKGTQEEAGDALTEISKAS